ncbi:MAG TPA: universal stress protein [Verrucomicrobiae bacterium]|jgi:nucleotide-binding universal stress UspA family protein|nr:universal stress protein [Verrucomicrobiae bacterium]
MKFKPAKRGKVVVEISPEEAQLPAVALAELQVKKILVPVDFSPSSQKALAYATAFARQFSAELTLLNVIEVIPPTPPTSPAPELMVPDSALLAEMLNEAADENLARWLKSINPAVARKSEVRVGSPYREIVQAAEDNETDLIVIGSHNRKALARVFLGSTAERVVRHAPCPVMVVRERERDFLHEEKPGKAEEER